MGRRVGAGNPGLQNRRQLAIVLLFGTSAFHKGMITMEARPLAAWMQVLGRMEESLAKTLERWGEPDTPVPTPTPETGGPTAQTVLQNIDQRFERMRTCLE